MGASLTCLASRQQTKCDQCGVDRLSLSPVPSLRRRSRAESSCDPLSLQEISISVIAKALIDGSIGTRKVSTLHFDLLQRILDRLVAQEALTLQLLQSLICPWLHHLHLEVLDGVDDDWMPVIAGVRHLASLNLSGAQLTNSGASWLSWLWELRELRLQHCSAITDAGLAQIGRLTCLQVLDLEGCDGLTAGCLTCLSELQALTRLNLGQCPGIQGPHIKHIAGLPHLRDLSVGWCRSLGDVRRQAGNTIQPLSGLTSLTSLNLGGTQVCDTQLREVAPHLSALQFLDLSRTHVTGGGLTALSGLAGSLRTLKLRGCDVGGAAGPSCGPLSVLTRLQSLDLSCSGVDSNSLSDLTALTALTELLLDMCHIGDEACRVFRQLPSLVVLDLSDTDVGDGGLVHLSRCTNLAWLSLCNTDAGDGAAASLAGLTRLTQLNLDSRGVSDVAVSLLQPLGSCLRELDLSGARITAKGAALLAATFTQLEKLDLCGGHVTDRACHELGKLISLRQLNLAQNRCLGDSGLRALARGLGRELQSLNLSYTSVTDSSLTLISEMQALQVVVLSCACVSEAGAARLCQTRPKLTVKATQNKKSGCL